MIQLTADDHRDLIAPPGWSDLKSVGVTYTSDDEPVLVTRRSELFNVTLNDDVVRLTPLWDALPAPLDTASITTAAAGPAGSYYLGSENGTFIQLDSQGVATLSLDRRAGFRAGAIRSIVVLPDGSFLLFFDGGSTWIAPLNHLRIYDSLNGLPSPSSAIAISGVTTFAGTSDGLFRSISGHRMVNVPEIDTGPIRAALRSVSRVRSEGVWAVAAAVVATRARGR